MAKKKSVRFSYNDGKQVSRIGVAEVFNIRAPMQLNIPANTKMSLKTGVMCDHPLVIYDARHVTARGLHLKNSGRIFDVGDEVVVDFETLSESAFLENGDILCRAAVLDNSDFMVE